MNEVEPCTIFFGEKYGHSQKCLVELYINIQNIFSEIWSIWEINSYRKIMEKTYKKRWKNSHQRLHWSLHWHSEKIKWGIVTNRFTSSTPTIQQIPCIQEMLSPTNDTNSTNAIQQCNNRLQRDCFSANPLCQNCQQVGSSQFCLQQE